MQTKNTLLDPVKEELANSITHGIGVVLSIIGIALLLPNAVLKGSWVAVLSCALFGGSMLLLYLFSTLYHSIQHETVKPVLKLLDHMGIYLLIAGTYSPFLLMQIQGTLGWVSFVLIWIIAVLGVLYKLFFRHRFEKLSLALYLGMGWLAVLIGKPFIETVPTSSIIFIILGGLSYTVGTWFYTQKNRPYFHAIWHVFVLAGTITHFIAVMILF
ncbi:MAG: hemolysin III family protein [Bacteroidetes Order II. Incertae sedis bacterium]|nr:hemolysin III family protein [Bacteroidetes Order II. bacterium]